MSKRKQRGKPCGKLEEEEAEERRGAQRLFIGEWYFMSKEKLEGEAIW